MEDFIRTYQIEEPVVDGLVSFFNDHSDKCKPGTTVTGVDKSVKDSKDLTVPISDYDNRIVNYKEELLDCIKQYRNDFLEYGFPTKTEISSLFNLQQYPPMGGFKTWHTERNSLQTITRCLVFMTYLNTVDVGGETEFFYQKVKFKPIKGLTLIWPSDFTHTHRGVPALNETKIIATGWINLHTLG